MATRKTLTESLKEVLGKDLDLTEKKIDADADADDETKSIKKADKAKGPPPSFARDKKGTPKKTKATEETEVDAEAIVDEEAEVVDETTAGDSLHPAARSVDDPKSKFEMITKAIGAMNAMKHDELTKWFTSAIAQSQTYGDTHPGDQHAKNQASVDMNPSPMAPVSTTPKTRYPMPTLGVKEDVEEMLKGFELSEEFKEQATTLFEAAVTARVLVENARLEEAFQTQLDEAVGEISEDLAEQVDNYLTYVVEHFLEENKVAVESSLRNELMDEFIEGLRSLMQQNNFNLPENKVDVVEALSEKVAELEGKFADSLAENTALKESLADIECERLVESFTEGLTLAESDKFMKLAEGVEFDGDMETFSKKLSVIKENYFGTKKAPAKTNIEEESFEGDEASTVKVDPAIARYLAAIDRTNKK